MATTTYVTHLPTCDLCAERAEYDAKTDDGRWANLCLTHFSAVGLGLGAGLGQRLIVGEKPTLTREETGRMIHEAIQGADWSALDDLVGDGDLAEYL